MIKEALSHYDNGNKKIAGVIALRLFLVLLFVVILIYTFKVISIHGWDLSVFFQDIVALNWSGQFNLDFSAHLAIFALWISWRHHFSVKGFIFGFCCMIGGVLFVATYLFIMSILTSGDTKELLLGKRRATIS